MPAECNYDVHDKELLAIMQAIKEWKRYMAGKLPMEVNKVTDHRNLLTFTTTKQLNGRQVRWMKTLVVFATGRGRAKMCRPALSPAGDLAHNSRRAPPRPAG